MLSLDDAAQPLDRELLDAPGGFAWWYVELSDPRRERALVCIWSFGLPFLPDYASKLRAGHAELPRARPSLNLALYEHGQLRHYVLHEFAEADARWTVEDDATERWRFGGTEISSELRRGRRQLRIDLDLPVDAVSGRWRGTLELTGVVPRIVSPLVGASAPSPHRWTPLVAGASGHAEIALPGAQKFRLDGSAYHDRNGSPLGLEALGVREWIWTRGRFPEEERIAYVLRGAHETQVLGFELASDGALRTSPLVDRGPVARKTRWGMPGRRRLVLGREGGPLSPWLDVRLGAPVDDGPFYLRYLGQASRGGGRAGEASLEVIAPRRIDLARHRPLVRMRVASDTRPNSMWLPLFQGDVRDGARQLERSLWVSLVRGLVGSAFDRSTKPGTAKSSTSNDSSTPNHRSSGTD